MQLSKHFTFGKLTITTSYPHLLEQNRKDAMRPEILVKLGVLAYGCEQVRWVLGAPLLESSGYRNPALNTAAGGSKTSSHMRAESADLVPVGLTVEEAFAKLLANGYKLTCIHKVIIEGVKGKIWLHVQVKSLPEQDTIFYRTVDGEAFTEVGRVVYGGAR